MSLAIVFIGTSKYSDFFHVWYQKASEYLCVDTKRTFVALTDRQLDQAENLITFHIEHEPWPFVTLKRWHFIEKVRNVIMDYDHVLYLDADMQVVSPIAYNEIFGSGKEYLGVHHPSHWIKYPPIYKYPGSYETRTDSEAYVSAEMAGPIYWQGCLWGGRTGAVLEMVGELKNRTDRDASRNIIARWHDESQMNRYFLERTNDIHTIGPEFAYPTGWGKSLGLEARILHVEHKKKG
jgi:hypothetical protein